LLRVSAPIKAICNGTVACWQPHHFERKVPSRSERGARVGDGRSYSPDRLDALVYAITDLMLRERVPVSIGRMTF